MSTPWWQAPWLVVDTETTGVDVETDRIVQVAAVKIAGKDVTGTHCHLINPGVEIPQGAIDVHGITNERARAEGVQPGGVLEKLVALIHQTWGWKQPVIACNAAFDLTLIDREARRHLGYGLDMDNALVVDPLVIDRGVDTYRPGSRKLVDLAAHYEVDCTDAHDALGDALTAARVVWRQARIHPAVRESTLPDLHERQIRWHRQWAAGYQAYLRTKAPEPDPAAVIDPSWPMRRLALTPAGKA